MPHIITLPVEARVSDAAIEMSSALPAINDAIKASSSRISPIGENQQPRMLKITAWLCHAGAPNANREAFLEEDLARAVLQGMFQAPYFGMIDYNHDFEAYGAWYKAEYKYDEQAGQYGILAEGAIFAWRYDELASRLLAIQNRQGHIDVSIACLYETIETAWDEMGPYKVVRNPVFFTTSVLDVEPADPHARGLTTESVDQTEEERQKALAEAARSFITDKESNPMHELVRKVEEMLGEHKADLAPLVEAAEKLPSMKAKISELEEIIEAQNKELAQRQTDRDALEVALETAKAEIEEMAQAMSRLEEEKMDLVAFKETVEKERAEAEARELLEARLEELGDRFRASLGGKESRASIEARIKNMDESEWQDFKEVLSIASAESYSDRSRKEGTLVMAASREGDELSKWVNN